MKKIKCILAALLICWLSFGSFCVPVSAANQTENSQTIVYFSDGSYLITTIISDIPSENHLPKAVNTKSGTKHQDYYDRNHNLVWTFRVHGSFSYDGYSSKATSADYSHNIYDSTWSFNGATASYSGATATAKGSFTQAILPNSVTLNLTCSAKGVLS